MSAANLARTCEAVERQSPDGDEALCVQNLLSTASYVHAALVCVCVCVCGVCVCVCVCDGGFPSFLEIAY